MSTRKEEKIKELVETLDRLYDEDEENDGNSVILSPPAPVRNDSILIISPPAPDRNDSILMLSTPAPLEIEELKTSDIPFWQENDVLLLACLLHTKNKNYYKGAKTVEHYFAKKNILRDGKILLNTGITSRYEALKKKIFMIK